MKKTIDFTVERNEEEIEVTIEGNYIRASRGQRDWLGGRRCGPPLEPDEPADFEIESVKDEVGNEIELTEKETKQAIEQAIEEIEEGRWDRCDED